MSTMNRHDESVTTSEHRIVTTPAARKALAALRIAFGLTFLWAFFDKLLALGYSTGAVLNEQGVKTGIDFFGKDAWIHDGNPTLGFLKFGASGPFKEFYNSIAGFVMYLMMWSVALWPANNPVLDEHILGALSMVVLGLTYAGDTWGVGASWGRSRWSAASGSCGKSWLRRLPG